jgi:hypothetical protein
VIQTITTEKVDPFPSTVQRLTLVDPLSESPTKLWNSTALAVRGDTIHAAQMIPIKTAVLVTDMVSPR